MKHERQSETLVHIKGEQAPHFMSLPIPIQELIQDYQGPSAHLDHARSIRETVDQFLLSAEESLASKIESFEVEYRELLNQVNEKEQDNGFVINLEFEQAKLEAFVHDIKALHHKFFNS